MKLYDILTSDLRFPSGTFSVQIFIWKFPIKHSWIVFFFGTKWNPSPWLSFLTSHLPSSIVAHYDHAATQYLNSFVYENVKNTMKINITYKAYLLRWRRKKIDNKNNINNLAMKIITLPPSPLSRSLSHLAITMTIHLPQYYERFYDMIPYPKCPHTHCEPITCSHTPLCLYNIHSTYIMCRWNLY